jgi:hypothetical protein
LSTIFREKYNEGNVTIYSYFVGLSLKNINNDIYFPNSGNVLKFDEENVILMYPVKILLKFRFQTMKQEF